VIQSSTASLAQRERVFAGYRLVLPEGTAYGTLIVRDGVIAEILVDDRPPADAAAAEFLLPGLVELHTDNLEKCVAPRPGTRWPLDAAALYHDRDLIGAGITTVCDAVAIGDVRSGSTRMTHSAQMISTIVDGARAGHFKVDHRLHLRCELSFFDLVPIVEQYVDEPLVSLISVMDHTPGERQFVDLETFKRYQVGRHGAPPEGIDAFIATLRANKERWSAPNRAAIVALAKARGIALASHDDAVPEHVAQAVEEGAAIAEFPTTFEAAETARDAGLRILMGAPNVVLGRSHSGNIAALDLAARGLVDVFSSDYAPQSLLHAAFVMAERLELPLHATVKTVSQTPAEVLGLEDRGAIAVGRRADLLSVRVQSGVPRLSGVHVLGERVG
jgi:alpha-D-ribose 1-methylphosphonate 5-triphosphate diphosphatase